MESVDTPLARIVARAVEEPGFRGRILYFPEEVADEYGATDAERKALCTGDLSGVDLSEERLVQARSLFITSHMSAGE